MASSDSGKYALLDQLADEFADCCRRGEHPSLQEYLDRFPELTSDLLAHVMSGDSAHSGHNMGEMR